jgi:hypothetical protein
LLEFPSKLCRTTWLWLPLRPPLPVADFHCARGL